MGKYNYKNTGEEGGTSRQKWSGCSSTRFIRGVEIADFGLT